jgi:thiamine kinase-like enzyme
MKLKKLKLYIDDLRTETLEAIKLDLSRYAHLAACKDTWKDILKAIEARRGKVEQKTKKAAKKAAKKEQATAQIPHS